MRLLRLTGWLLLAAAPCALAVLQLGRLHPDEVYQYLEPAFERVHGYGILAWEWHTGLRNWAYPLLLAGLLRVCDGLGIVHPVAYRAVLAVPQLLLHAWALWAVYRWTARHAPSGAGLALGVVALQGIVVAYAGRTLGESLSVDLLWIALEALDRPGADAPAGLTAGIFLGLAVVARYSSAVPVAGALGFLAVAGSYRRLSWAVGGGAAVALALGALDAVTWGSPFHSLWAYLQFNVLSGEAARQFGSSPVTAYLVPLALSTPLWAWPGLGVALQQRWRWVGPSLCAALAYLLALFLSPHKEDRFVYPAAQLLAFAAAPGLAWSVARAGTMRVQALLWGAALAASALTWTAVPDVRGDQFRAIVSATRAPSAQGLLVVGEGLWGSGGYFYIGKRIPWSTCDWPHDAAFRQAMSDPRFNRAVTFEGRGVADLESHGFRVVDRVGRESVLER